MLDGLTPYLPLPPPCERPCRQQVFTSCVPLFRLTRCPADTTLTHRKPESSIAPYLTELQGRTKEDGIRIGSYPLFQHGVYVSFIGYDRDVVRRLAEETAQALEGRLVSDQEAREMVKVKERGAV